MTFIEFLFHILWKDTSYFGGSLKPVGYKDIFTHKCYTVCVLNKNYTFSDK